MSKRELWRKHVMAELAAQGVTVIALAHGAFRLIGLHGDLTVTDVADVTPRELARLSRIHP